VSEHPQIEALRQGADIIIATPGRLFDLMSRRHGDFSTVKFLVLDEADRMLDMGFLPSIRDILRSLPTQRQTLLFSATLPREIEALTHQFQRSPKTIQIGRRANPAETVTQRLYEVPRHLKINLLAQLLRDEKLDTVLVFSRTKHGADKIARKLDQLGIKTATIHSNRSQNQRQRALNDFKSGLVRVLVATDIAARGIDVEGISHVVNFDFPLHCEDYVHRIGRTGRAQAAGDAISFACPEEMEAVRDVERFIACRIVRLRAEGFNYSEPPQAGNSQSPNNRLAFPGRSNQPHPARNQATRPTYRLKSSGSKRR
jgi:ATP-dependent RNA helicase RhlE